MGGGGFVKRTNLCLRLGGQLQLNLLRRQSKRLQVLGIGQNLLVLQGHVLQHVLQQPLVEILPAQVVVSCSKREAV